MGQRGFARCLDYRPIACPITGSTEHRLGADTVAAATIGTRMSLIAAIPFFRSIFPAYARPATPGSQPPAKIRRTWRLDAFSFRRQARGTNETILLHPVRQLGKPEDGLLLRFHPGGAGRRCLGHIRPAFSLQR